MEKKSENCQLLMKEPAKMQYLSKISSLRVLDHLKAHSEVGVGVRESEVILLIRRHFNVDSMEVNLG